MKTVRLMGIGRPLAEQRLPDPEPRSGEVLVRVRAAGVCHSDAHYRAGSSPVSHFPLTPGHEIAGEIVALGEGVEARAVGERVCLHYLVTCGSCPFCRSGHEQFCPRGEMIGKHRDGGFAELIAVPAANAVALPPEISFEQGAVLMCSSATSLHALRKARLRAGESVAVFGVGGLGLSAVQLARALGALDVYAVDIDPGRLSLAEAYGAKPIQASGVDPVARIREMTGGRGVDVALELAGLPLTTRQAVRSLAVFGRAALAGITPDAVEIMPYTELIGREAEVVGVSDHLLSEMGLLVELARRGTLDLGRVVTRTIPLQEAAVNAALDELDRFAAGGRTVIIPDR
jgi:2-desacetyl-2-hydroxyethyl bacteriochlorophyllide A dehydrogenase